MIKSRTSTSRATSAKLRRRAEARLGRRPAELPHDPTDDPRRLVHELHVHQIELELQNEELRAAREETESALQRYTQIFDFAPIGYFVLSADGAIRQANLAGAALVGIARWALIGRRMARFVSEAHAALLDAFLARVLAAAGEQSETCELDLVSDGTALRNARLVGTMLEPPAKTLLLAVEDVTARKRAELALRDECRRKDAVIATLRALGKHVEGGRQGIVGDPPPELDDLD